MMNTLLCEGGDPTASRSPMGAGEAAVFCRYHTGDEVISGQDQIVFEPAASYRHYHTCMMYNILTGNVRPRHRAMNTACAEALDACQQHLSAGNTVGDLFAAHEQVMQSSWIYPCCLERRWILRRHQLPSLLDGLANDLERQPPDA